MNLKPIPSEAVYVELDETSQMYGVFGATSGFCHLQTSDKEEAVRLQKTLTPSKPIKLSKAQALLLVAIQAQGGSYNVVDTYKPMLKLAELGLVKKTHQGTYGHSTFSLTLAGKGYTTSL